MTESLKVMTRDATRRIAQYAFEYAFLNNRAKVTAVHKANIMKKADGIFLESCQEVAKQYSQVRAAAAMGCASSIRCRCAPPAHAHCPTPCRAALLCRLSTRRSSWTTA